MKLVLLMKEWTYYILKLLRTSAIWPDEFITNFNPHQGWQIYICNTWYSFLDRLLEFLSGYSSFHHPHRANHKLNVKLKKYQFCVICCCVFAMCVCLSGWGSNHDGNMNQPQCCFTSNETIWTIRDKDGPTNERYILVCDSGDNFTVICTVSTTEPFLSDWDQPKSPAKEAGLL